MKLKDAESFLSWISTEHPHILLGITSNTPARTMETGQLSSALSQRSSLRCDRTHTPCRLHLSCLGTVLPMNGYHDFFKWFVCSQDVGVEKVRCAFSKRSYTNKSSPT